MAGRLALLIVASLFCVFSLVLGGVLLSEALGPTPIEELLENQDDYSPAEADRLGTDDDPIGYGGVPGPITDSADLRVRYGAVSEPYWRTGSYDTFTGTTWQSTHQSTIYDGTPLEAGDHPYEVQSWGAEELIPALWVPIAVDESIADNVLIRGDGSFQLRNDLSPGHSYRISSDLPEWSYEQLLEIGDTGSPDPLYTDLPEGQPARLQEHTDEVAADARTPYETALLIERWLLLNKEYSFNATASSEWVADEFVFELEAGTSEQFATAMTTMLRTQDVPARYVTGFAPGDRTDGGAHVVRGHHAHAWVEVYFEEVGWVQFDPTPPDRIVERGELASADAQALGSTEPTQPEQAEATTLEQAEATTLEQAEATTLEQAEATTLEQAEATTLEQAGGGQEPTGRLAAMQSLVGATTVLLGDEWEPVDPPPAIEVLDEDGEPVETLIPGTTVTLAVTRDGEPLEGHRVLFDGLEAGITDENGQIQVELPYVRSITVVVQSPVDDPNGEDEDDPPDNGEDDPNGDPSNETEQELEIGDEVMGEDGLGALNPGDSTGVGGEIGFDNSTFGNSDTSVHLLVESTAPAYWRTDAYDHYSGDGWQLTGDIEPFDSDPDEIVTEGEYVEYQITIERPASSLPTVWQPETITGVEDLRVTEGGGIRPAQQLPTGTTYEGTSYKPEDDVDRLRSADGSVPPAIHARYTQLPAHSSQRLAELTEDIVADTPTTYDAAMAVQQWLRDHKGYSLEASATSEDIADEFVFHMEAGYCEYFATAMVSMLRSQDIPARYVVGYATGDQVGDGIYEVRGMNAHAWVEVYFPEVGWVTFDPTPGDERLAAEEAALQEADPDAQYNPTTEGSPGEEFHTDGIRREAGQIVDASDYVVGGYADHLSPPDEVRVGESPLPLTDQIRFVVTPVDGEDDVVPLDTTTRGSNDGSVLTLASVDEPGALETLAMSDPRERDVRGATRERVTALGTSLAVVDEEEDEDDGEAGSELSLETDIHITLGEEDRSGANVTLKATINHVPVTNARVQSRTADGRTVLTTATTDDRGRTTLELPYYEEVMIIVSRGEAVGQVDHTVDVDLAMSLHDEPIPGGSVDVTVTSHGEPAPGVTVAPGEVETAADGSATVTIPYAELVEIEATTGEARVVELATFDSTMAVRGEPVPGEEMSVEVTTDGVGIAGLPVEARPGDGDRYTNRTDEMGMANVTVPFANETRIVAAEDDLHLEEAYETVGQLDIETSGLAIPGRTIGVEVTIDGTPVPEAVVWVGNTRVAVTDENGTAAVTVPVNPTSAGTITATRGDLRAQTEPGTTMGWLILLTVLFGSAGAGVLVWRSWSETAQSRLHVALIALIGKSIQVATVVQTRMQALAAFLAGLLRGENRAAFFRQLKADIRAFLADPVGTIQGSVLVQELLVFLGLAEGKPATQSRAPTGGHRSTARDRPSTASQPVGATSPGEPEEVTDVEKAWDRFIGLANAEASDTPSEVAERACEQGLSRGPVEQLTRTYLAHRFGAMLSEDDAYSRIQSALAELEHEARK